MVTGKQTEGLLIITVPASLKRACESCSALIWTSAQIKVQTGHFSTDRAMASADECVWSYDR